MIGVIEPGVRSLVAATRNGSVGVIGTVGTIGSGAYQHAVAGGRRRREAHVRGVPRVRRVRRAGRDRPPIRSTCWPSGSSPRLRDAKVDTLLLGCTHYPFLARTIGDVMGRDVVLVDSADETAFRVSAQLVELGLARDTGGDASLPRGRHRFESSGDVTVFRTLGSRLLGPELDVVEHVTWG